MTLALNPDLLEKARIVAVRRHTTVTQLVRDHLEALVQAEDEASGLRQRLVARLDQPELDVGAPRWTREDLHERW